jgi:hypothetical protein
MWGPDSRYVHLGEAEFCAQSVDLVRRAQDEQIPLRILGAMAVYIHAGHRPETLTRYRALERLGPGRPIFTDLDLVGYSDRQKNTARFFQETMGFKPDFHVNALFSGRRNVFRHPDSLFDVDVFYDLLSFSHDVRFRGSLGGDRLELDFPTISLADVILEKLQIHHINRKDLVDLYALLSSHDIASGPQPDSADGAYIAKVLCDEWGFEYDARSNLQKLRGFSESLAAENRATSDDGARVMAGIESIIQFVDHEPKSKEWQRRARKGTSKPWFNEVDEIER